MRWLLVSTSAYVRRAATRASPQCYSERQRDGKRSKGRGSRQMTLARLRSLLKQLPTGPINKVVVLEVERLLAVCWGELQKATIDQGFEPYKALGRTEKTTWTPPLLEFDIERHGDTVMGSVYADVHHWIVDTKTGIASLEVGGRRQVREKANPLNTEELAAQIASLILSNTSDLRLVWKAEGKVQLVIAQIIPQTNRMTTNSRRKRFRQSLSDILEGHGWRMTAMNTFEKVI
jgi:hypothetical protein